MESEGFEEYEDPGPASVSSSNNARQRRVRIAAIVMCLLMALPILGIFLIQVLS